MKQSYQELLFAINPDWYVRTNPSTSLMCFGFEVGDGWYQLLNQGMERIHRHLDDKYYFPDGYPEFQVTQVKEKFGTLRFYYYGGDQHIENITDAMEIASSLICEFCGHSGSTRDNMPWIHTLCDSCLADYHKGRRVYGWQGKGPTPTKEQEQQEGPAQEGQDESS